MIHHFDHYQSQIIHITRSCFYFFELRISHTQNIFQYARLPSVVIQYNET